ncbi:hypothetical protein J7E50_02855 [Pedobacter sp. ISL-68]|uniref:hypothetical protein n=1 Tax=unclassified Pedobacter TaxID=2628915 RepID=UPI001BE56B6D|nr:MULTISPECIES: hypothetical protein [unclassified Pedobacter]MBT2560160.1 hypothetical protein [Pedobacter sp. ISL-64]MBT2589139.1 hypothetical protein [Pedobacter sp. ISL-68]
MENLHEYIFEKTEKELHDQSLAIHYEENNRAWLHGMPISYRNKLCTQDDLIIHEYEGGKIELVSVSLIDGKETVIKRLDI